MKTQPFLLHALSPIHAGTGHAVDVIDLPIARQRATGIPFVPGPSLKGVLRDAQRPADATTADTWRAVYGPDTANAKDHAGALAVGDAVLLALPVRSFRGTFAWVTSPLLLELAQRDLGGALAIPAIVGAGARVGARSICVHDGVLLLEDLDLPATEDEATTAWAAWLGALLYPGKDLVEKRLAIVDDETMTFLWETRTQLDARVSIDATGTVKDGALWLEESLPRRVGAPRARRGRAQPLRPGVDGRECRPGPRDQGPAAAGRRQSHRRSRSVSHGSHHHAEGGGAPCLTSKPVPPRLCRVTSAGLASRTSASPRSSTPPTPRSLRKPTRAWSCPSVSTSVAWGCPQRSR